MNLIIERLQLALSRTSAKSEKQTLTVNRFNDGN
jgi:hypothetical protein